ncbi:unnamed protein product, partial [Cyprideis torosa]
MQKIQKSIISVASESSLSRAEINVAEPSRAFSELNCSYASRTCAILSIFAQKSAIFFAKWNVSDPPIPAWWVIMPMRWLINDETHPVLEPLSDSTFIIPRCLFLDPTDRHLTRDLENITSGIVCLLTTTLQRLFE